MEKYRLVAEHKAEDDSHDFPSSEPGNEQMDAPEVRITQQGKPRNYISYALSLFVSKRYTEKSGGHCCTVVILVLISIIIVSHLVSFYIPHRQKALKP
jgi:hypothetical protein